MRLQIASLVPAELQRNQSKRHKKLGAPRPNTRTHNACCLAQKETRCRKDAHPLKCQRPTQSHTCRAGPRAPPRPHPRRRSLARRRAHTRVIRRTRTRTRTRTMKRKRTRGANCSRNQRACCWESASLLSWRTSFGPRACCTAARRTGRRGHTNEAERRGRAAGTGTGTRGLLRRLSGPGAVDGDAVWTCHGGSWREMPESATGVILSGGPVEVVCRDSISIVTVMMAEMGVDMGVVGTDDDEFGCRGIANVLAFWFFLSVA